MKFNWITALITASAIAILALIAIQVRWIQHSQQLLDEQFNQRVNMALCNTVEKLADEESCSKPLQASCSVMSSQSCCRQLDTLLASPLFDQTLGDALNFYQIDLPYKANIGSNSNLSEDGELPPFSCTLNPLLDSDSHYIQLDFDGKQEFLLNKMGEMLGSSIFILLFICTIFGMATYHLLRQKKISELNREFFNHMAHEFRTPLTNIRLASNLLQKKQGDLQSSPYLQIIRQEGDHLMQQVEQVLHLARLEKKDIQLERKNTDLHLLLQETVQSMHLRQAERAAEIQLELPDYPLQHAVDPLHLSNALRNLIDNSLKYCQEIPRILIRLSGTPETITLTLEDNGCGWEATENKKVFEKFYQANQSHQRKGFGLGLAYVKRVIELHGGRIAVQSKKDRGTNFQIFLPL